MRTTTLAMLAGLLAQGAHARTPPPTSAPPVHAAVFAQGAVTTKGSQCTPLAGVAQLCLTTPYAGRPPIARDVLRARKDTFAQVAARVPVATLVTLLEERVVEGAGTYAISDVGDGLDHAALLDPAALVGRFGREVRVATPDHRTLVVWRDQGGTFDKLMGVGVWKLHDAAKRGATLAGETRSPAVAVSPVVLRWSGDAWEEVGVASLAPDGGGPHAGPDGYEGKEAPPDGHP